MATWLAAPAALAPPAVPAALALLAVPVALAVALLALAGLAAAMADVVVSSVTKVLPGAGLARWLQPPASLRNLQ